MIHAGVGLSHLSQTREAALEATGRALAGLGGDRPHFCVAFSTAHHAETVDDLLEAIAWSGETPYVVGCSGAGVIAGSTEIEAAPGLTVLAVSSDQLRGTPFLFEDEGDHGLSAGARIGKRLDGSKGTGDLVLVWPDPYNVRPDRLLQGIDSALEGVPVAGGAAAGRSAEEGTFQFSGAEWRSAAVAGIRLGGRFRHRVVVTQGCRPLGPPLRVSNSHENLVLELDGRPALDVLRERAPEHHFGPDGRPFDYLFVGLLPDPLDPRYAPGEYRVRNILTSDDDTGVIGIAEAVEEGDYVVLVERERAAAREDLRRVLETVSAEHSAADYRFALYFDCMARGRSLYRESPVDARLIAEALPGVPLAGFFCAAEMAPLRGVNHLLTYTGVLVLVGE